MAKLFNRSYTRDELMKQIGDISQVADARQGRLASGRAQGVSVIDVTTGGGLGVSILPDRGMDIAGASYKGIPLSFVSKCGVVSPAYQNLAGLGFLRSFTAGLLTTCGLTQVGPPCEDGGDSLGLHGRVSNIPAEDVSVIREWEGDEFVMRVRGKVREGAVFAEQLVLTRTVTAVMGENKITISDAVENAGYREAPFMLLYHFNFGYPIVSADTKLYHSPAQITPRDEAAQPGLFACETFEAPTPGYAEQVFFYDMDARDDRVFACLFNERLGVGAYLRYRKSELPILAEWKNMGEGEYVVGLEPCIIPPMGRAAAREAGKLAFLQPGEQRRFEIEVGVVDGRDALDALCKK